MAHRPSSPTPDPPANQARREELRRWLEQRRDSIWTTPVSYAQQRLWFLDQLSPGGAVYNVCRALRLRGPLSIPALEKAHREIIRRHQAFRTFFTHREGKPVQCIRSASPFALDPIPVSPADLEQHEAGLRARVREKGAEPFQLDQAPLFRVHLFQISPEDHVILWVMHHIISDGTSMAVLFRDLSTAYQNVLREQPPTLAPLALDYADFVAWQRSWFEAGGLDEDLRYWRTKLSDPPPPVHLPADKPRPDVQSYRGDLIALDFPESLHDQIQHLARQERTTPFLVLMAAFRALLHRYTGQEDIAIGTPIANRQRPEFQSLVGFFANSIVLRTDMGQDPSFQALLTREMETAQGAFLHQDLPFERLVEEVQPERDLARTPLFQVMLALLDDPVQHLALPQIEVEEWVVGNGTSKFDLFLSLERRSGKLRGFWEYSTDLFERGTIERLARHYVRLLEQALEHPTQPVSRLTLLTPEELNHLLWELNRTERKYPAGRTLVDLVEEQARVTPDATALVYQEPEAGTQLIRWSYDELMQRADRLAALLRRQGVGAESLVAVCLERTPTLAVALLAVLKAGGAYVPLDPRYPRQRIQFMVEDTKACLILTQSNLHDQLPALEMPVWHLDSPDLLEKLTPDDEAGRRKPVRHAQESHLAYLIFTSGSTGRPKAVALEHRNAVALIDWARDVFTPSELAHVLFSTSVCFDLSIFELFVTWSVGGAVHLCDNALALPSLTHRDEITLINTVPSAMAELVRLDAIPKSVITVNLAGEFLPTELVDQIYALPHIQKVYDLYGPSEDTTYSTWTLRERGGRPNIGRPIFNSQAYILDPHRQPVPFGVPGELYLGGAGIARGYLHRPDLTAERFVPNPFPKTPGPRLYRTGDLVRYLPDGRIEYCGRLDHQVKIRGYRIELGEIEAELRQHPQISDAVVIAQDGQEGDKRIVAYLVQREPAEDTLQNQQTALQSEQLKQWESVWEETYRQSHQAGNPSFNLVGWNSSFTGKPIPSTEMSEWVEETVRRILRLKPRRVLEIGCGTGLLLFRIAPQVESFHGVDISQHVVDALHSFLNRPGHELPHVKVSQGSADQLASFTRPDEFDLVVINSVAQYFPSRDYLLSVVRGALRCLRPGGKLFLGDLRSHRLLKAFHHSTQLALAPEDLTIRELKKRIHQSMSREQELAVDPALFQTWRTNLRGLGDIEVFLKDGEGDNELTRYRYDLVIHVGQPSEPASISWHDAHAQPVSREQLESWAEKVSKDPAGVIAIRRLPNARLRHDALLMERLPELDPELRAGQLRAEIEHTRGTAFTPQQLYRLGRELDLEVQVRWSTHGQEFEMDVVMASREAARSRRLFQEPTEAPGRKGSRFWANDPLQGVFARRLLPNLKSTLETRLPDYMIPSAFVVLDAIPRNSNGKLNRKALPVPERDRDRSSTSIQAPRNPAEARLCRIWGELLHLDQVGIQEDFFDLGGHSLLATQVISRIRQDWRTDVPLRMLFEFPTIERLAGALASQGARLVEAVTAVEPGSGANTSPEGPRPLHQERGPLSFSQQRLWFLAQFEPDSFTYIIGPFFRIEGRVDRNALEKALSWLQVRHPSLRTAFQSAEGVPSQVIQPPQPVVVQCEPFSPSPGLDPVKWMEDRAASLRKVPFDLSNGYLMRAWLLSMSEHSHGLQLSIHHACCDGWSMSILTRELSLAYAAAMEGRSPVWPELPIQYLDYAIWQREWMQGPVLDRQLAFWKKNLENAPAFLQLPTDRPRPALQTYRGNNHDFRIPASVVQEIQSLAARTDSTTFMVTLGAFYLLLHRYTSQEDLCVGTPIAHRTRKETEGVIGFFVNSLVLRADVGGNPTVTEWIRRVRKTALDAYDHQDLPLEKLVEELQPERNLAYSPLFQVMFVVQNTPGHRLEFPGCQPSRLEYPGGTSKFDLTLFLEPQDGEILATLEYNEDLFHPLSMQRFAGHFLHLLENMVRRPTARVADLPFVTAPEQALVLEEWNRTQTPYSSQLCAQQCVELQALRTPHQSAVQHLDQTLSYSELNTRANQLGHELQALGVGPDVRVALLLPRSIHQPLALLAALKAGGCYVPIDPHYPEDRIQLMLEEARAKVILTESALVDRWRGHADHIVALDTWRGNNFVSNPPPAQRNPDRLAYVIFTSGSTGRPKGVAMPHRALVNLVEWQCRNSNAGLGTRTLQFASLSFDVHFQEFFATWASGGTVVLTDETTRRDSMALLQFLVEQRIERMFLPYVALQQLAEAAALRPEWGASLREVVTAGEALLCTPALKNWFARMPGCTLENQYGPSETHVITAYRLPASPQDWPELPPIGRPIANAQTYVLSAGLSPVPPGVPGELHLSGIPLARGYLDRPEWTNEKFIPNPFVPGQRLYRTGDLARWTNRGELEFLGRADDQVKIRGFRVELGEVESVLAKHPAVREAAVAALQDGPGRRLVAYVVTKPGHPFSQDALKEFVRARLPDYMTPGLVISLEKLPLTPSGKINRRALPQPKPEDFSGGREYSPPTGELESKIAAIWQELLQVPRVGSQDHFFELGGHSLLIVQLQSKLQSALGRNIAVVDLFRYPTVAALARALSQDQPDSLNLDPIQERMRKQREMLARRNKGRNP